MSIRFRCIEDVCLCCICSLRASREFGAAIDPDDACCQGCHDEMAATEWPGRRCGSLPPYP